MRCLPAYMCFTVRDLWTYVTLPGCYLCKLICTLQEVQIHGEVNLKKHVQRLVAASKYRDVPKTQRLGCPPRLSGTRHTATDNVAVTLDDHNHLQRLQSSSIKNMLQQCPKKIQETCSLFNYNVRLPLLYGWNWYSIVVACFWYPQFGHKQFYPIL